MNIFMRAAALLLMPAGLIFGIVQLFKGNIALGLIGGPVIIGIGIAYMIYDDKKHPGSANPIPVGSPEYKEKMKWLEDRDKLIAERAANPSYRPSVSAPKDDEPVRCPKCGSAQITTGTKGFSVGKAAAGGILIGPVGLIGGAIGAKKVKLTCLKCGHSWKIT